MRRQIVTSAASESDPLLRRCVVSIWEHWTDGVAVYSDKDADAIPQWADTKARLPVTNPNASKPTNYIWNVRKYAVKVFVWLDAAERLGHGILTWLDADTVTTADVPDGFSESLLGDADVAYLGRGDMHPETGCVVFRIPEALPLLRACRQTYVSGAFVQLTDGWSDCHVFRSALRSVPVKARDLTSHLHDGPWNSRVDAFALSPLGHYVTHLKGSARKREALCAS